MNKAVVEYRAENLRIARLLNGFSQQELGNRISTSRQYVHQLESGIKEPSEDLLPSLVEALRVSKSFLYGTAITELKSEQCHFRKRRTTTQSVCSQVLAYGSVLEKFLDAVKSYVDLPTPFVVNELAEKFGKYDFMTIRDIDLAAREYRIMSGFSTDTPIENITDLIESQGIFITSFNGVSEKVDALSFFRRHQVILRNTSKDSPGRQRFDLSHELGHLILHNGVETGDSETEGQADWFAGSFLFPEEAFRREFPLCLDSIGRIDWSRLVELKIRWKVSLKSIIYRAHVFGLISARQYRTANIHISKSGWSKKEKGDDEIAMEEPSLISECIEVITDSLNIPFENFSDLIGVDAEFLNELFDLQLELKERMPNLYAINSFRV